MEQPEWEADLDFIAGTYRDLERVGHIPMGAVSEYVNWDEIKDLIRAAIKEAVYAQIEKDACICELLLLSREEAKRTDTGHRGYLYQKAIHNAAMAIRNQATDETI